MAGPTCRGVYIQTPEDARLIFHAVEMQLLPMVTRRLDQEEKQRIAPGSVYVWEEGGSSNPVSGTGIERWTDGIHWGPSRVKDGFLFYEEKRDKYRANNQLYNVDNLTIAKMDKNLFHKQTYTVWVDRQDGRRKWHLIAYFTEETLGTLKNVRQIPVLSNLQVPPSSYPSARHVKGRPEHIFGQRHSNSPPRTAGSGSQSPTSPLSPTSPASASAYHRFTNSPRTRTPPPQLLPGLWPRADAVSTTSSTTNYMVVDRTPVYAQPRPQRFVQGTTAFAQAVDAVGHGPRVLASPSRPSRLFQNRSPEDEKLLGRFAGSAEGFY